jgi:hypothetical protein
MNTAVTTPQSFEDRVYQKMRENIGELMTDEEMKKLLETAITKMFFTEKRIDRRGYGYSGDITVEPPEIYNLVRELVEPKLRAALREYLNEHSAEVQKAIDTALAGGLTQALATALNRMMSEPFLALQSQLYSVMSANDLRSGS